jgi:hypothetical protein
MLTILTAAEIGDQIVNVLERGLAATRAELQKLGVEYQGGKPLIMPTGWRVPRRIAFSPPSPAASASPGGIGISIDQIPSTVTSSTHTVPKRDDGMR